MMISPLFSDDLAISTHIPVRSGIFMASPPPPLCAYERIEAIECGPDYYDVQGRDYLGVHKAPYIHGPKLHPLRSPGLVTMESPPPGRAPEEHHRTD